MLNFLLRNKGSIVKYGGVFILLSCNKKIGSIWLSISFQVINNIILQSATLWRAHRAAPWVNQVIWELNGRNVCSYHYDEWLMLLIINDDLQSSIENFSVMVIIRSNMMCSWTGKIWIGWIYVNVLFKYNFLL